MVLNTLRCLALLVLLFSAPSQALEPARAFQSKNTQPQSSSPTNAMAFCALEMLTPTEGEDFEMSQYLAHLYRALKKRWLADMPPSVEKGQKGKNAVEFRVLQDGSVPEDSLKMVSRSEKKDFDAASLQAIREAAPFEHLPEKFTKPFISLRFHFYYNLPLPKSGEPL